MIKNSTTLLILIQGSMAVALAGTDQAPAYAREQEKDGAPFIDHNSNVSSTAYDENYWLSNTDNSLSKLRRLRNMLKSVQKDSAIAGNALVNTIDVHTLSANQVGNLNIPPIPFPLGSVAVPGPIDSPLLYACLTDLNKLLNKIRQDEKLLALPTQLSQETSSLWRRVQLATDNMVGNYNTLVGLSAAPHRNAESICKRLVTIHDNASQIKESLAPVYAAIASRSERSRIAGNRRSNLLY